MKLFLQLIFGCRHPDLWRTPSILKVDGVLSSTRMGSVSLNQTTVQQAQVLISQSWKGNEPMIFGAQGLHPRVVGACLGKGLKSRQSSNL